MAGLEKIFANFCAVLFFCAAFFYFLAFFFKMVIFYINDLNQYYHTYQKDGKKI